MSFPSTIHGVLMDAAGTLISPSEPVGETYARVALDHDAPIPARRLGEAFRRVMAEAQDVAYGDVQAEGIDALERAWWRQRVRDTFRSADSTLPPRDFEACFETLFAHFARPEAWRLRPGARQALDRLRLAGLRLAIVSNFDRRLRPLLAGLDVVGYFELVVLPSDCGAAKPAPAIFQHALAALALPPDACVFVGDDTRRDIAAARDVGMHAIDVSALATLAELPEAIARLEVAGGAEPSTSPGGTPA